MNDVRTTLDPEAMPAAIEANGIACCKAWAAWPEMELHDGPEMTWTLTDVPFAFFNNVFGARLAAEAAPAAIEQAKARAAGRNVPMFWWTGSTMRPADLPSTLEAAGFAHTFDAVGMAMRLSDVADAPAPPGVTIGEALDGAGLRSWSRVCTGVYGFPDFAAAAWLEMHQAIPLGPRQPYRHFVAGLGGEPVATASVYMGEGVAGISSVATVDAARGKGIGSAVTAAALRAARDAGYRIGVLFSSPDGLGMYRRLGFRRYCMGGCYAWSADGSPSPSLDSHA